MIGGLLGEVLFQALLFLIILRLIAKHEADYDFGKLAMLSGVITMCTTVLTLVAADKGMIYIPIGYLSAFVVAVWLLVQFCWVPVWKALVAVIIVIPAKAGLRILLMLALGKAIGSGPQAADYPAAAIADAFEVESAEMSESDLCVQELHGWMNWQIPMGGQIAILKEICDAQNPPAMITGITSLIPTGSDSSTPLRAGNLKITVQTGQSKPEGAAAIMKVFSASEAVKACSGEVNMDRMLLEPPGSQNLIFTMISAYPLKPLLAAVPPTAQIEAAKALASILPATDATATASNQIRAVTDSIGFKVTRLMEVPAAALSNSSGLVGIHSMSIAGRGPWAAVIGTLNGLEQNPCLQIESFSLRPLTDGTNWEMSARIEQAVWKTDENLPLAAALLAGAGLQ
ncbi:MAG: hypothetical protein AB7T27_12070 [Kiritimatiellia bacterium]